MAFEKFRQAILDWCELQLSTNPPLNDRMKGYRKGIRETKSYVLFEIDKLTEKLEKRFEKAQRLIFAKSRAIEYSAIISELFKVLKKED